MGSVDKQCSLPFGSSSHLYSTSLRTNARVKVTAPSHLLLNRSYTGRERWQRRFPCRKLSFRRCRNQSFPNRLLPSKLAGSTHSLRFFAGLFFRWLFVRTSSLHFSEDALALHFLFQNAKRLIDVVIADKYLQYRLLQSFDVSPCRNAAPFRICFGRTSALFNPNGLSIDSAQKPDQYKDRAGRATVPVHP